MNFGRAHKTTTYLAVWCAYLSLLLSSELSLPAAALSFAGVVASWWWEAPRVRVERWQKAWTAVGLVVFGWSVLAFLAGDDLVLVGSELILYLLVAKLFGRRSSRDYLQVYVLSFLMLVAATVVNSDITFGLFFLGYVVTSTWALILLHLRREIEENYLVRHEGTQTSQQVQISRILGSKRIVGAGFFAGTGAMSLVVFAGALVLFLAIPRIGFGLFFDKNRGGVTLAGFSDGVKLGGHGVIKDDDTVVMRVEVSGPYEGRDAPYLHWRGVAFDEYREGEWRRSKKAPRTEKQTVLDGGLATYHVRYDDPARPPERELTASLAGLVQQDIYLEPLGNDVLFGASMPAAFRVDPPLGQKPRDREERNDEIRFHHSAGIKYTVFSRLERPPLAVMRASRPRVLPAGFDHYLALPPEVTSRTRALAHQITAGKAGDYQKAAAIESWLQGNLGYTLEMVSPARGQEPVDFFLFDRRKGHCEYFSSAMAIMLREVGIPSRDVNGFLGGEWNEYDSYIAVRAGDAHSWVEAYLGDAGWVTFDPTPSGSIDQLGRGGEGFMDRLHRMADTVRFKWFKWIIEYDLDAQLAFLDSLGNIFDGRGGGSFKERWRGVRTWAAEHRVLVTASLVALAAAIAGFVLWRRRRRGPPGAARARRERDPVAAIYLRVLRALGRRGYARAPSLTPREHARALERDRAPGAAELAELTEIYYTAEYAGGASDPAARARAAALARAIEDAVRAAPRRAGDVLASPRR
jgi:transglutaminase-like putative cysteine protease